MKITAILLNKRQECRAQCPEPKLEDGELEQERVFTPWGSLLYPSLVCSFLPISFLIGSLNYHVTLQLFYYWSVRLGLHVTK